MGGVVAMNSAFLSVGFSLDVERLLNYCRDGAYSNDQRNGVRKAHGQKTLTVMLRAGRHSSALY